MRPSTEAPEVEEAATPSVDRPSDGTVEQEEEDIESPLKEAEPLRKKPKVSPVPAQSSAQVKVKKNIVKPSTSKLVKPKAEPGQPSILESLFKPRKATGPF